jgi:hypothetical protein
VMTAGVFATILVAAATASPWIALAIGTCFGTGRGLAVLLGRGIVSPAGLSELHRHLAALRRPIRVTVAMTFACVALALGALSWPNAPAATFLVVGVVSARFFRSASLHTGVRRARPGMSMRTRKPVAEQLSDGTWRWSCSGSRTASRRFFGRERIRAGRRRDLARHGRLLAPARYRG